MINMWLVLLSFFIVADAQGDLCNSTTCTNGQVDYFYLPAYGPYSFAYVHSPEHPPLQSVQSTNITKGLIVIHGDARNVQDYYCWMRLGVNLAGQSESTYIFAPHYLETGDNFTNTTMFWTTGTWKESGLTSPLQRPRVSSFKILDDVLLVFSNKTLFPSLNEILVVGHSAGGQTVQRYAISTPIDPQVQALNVTLRYVVENSGSFTYLDKARAVISPPVATCGACNASTVKSTVYTFALVDNATAQSCPEYNDWKMGLDDRLAYANARSLADIRSQYRSKDVSYVLGTLDTCNRDFGNCSCTDNSLDRSCDAIIQGYCRFERGAIYYQYLQYYYNATSTPVHKLYYVEGIGHDGCRMLTNNVTLKILFPGYEPTPPPAVCNADFVQVKTGGWIDGGQDVSQFLVTVVAGSQNLYAVRFNAATNGASFSPYNIDHVAGSVYTFPPWRYQNGAIPAFSNVTFGYIIGSSSPATFTFAQDPCTPSLCAIYVSQAIVNTWVSGENTYKQYAFSVVNTGTTTVTSVKITVNFSGGAFISASWNISPSTSIAGVGSQDFTCSFYGIAPGAAYSDCGYILSVATSNDTSTSSLITSNQGNCL